MLGPRQDARWGDSSGSEAAAKICHGICPASVIRMSFQSYLVSPTSPDVPPQAAGVKKIPMGGGREVQSFTITYSSHIFVQEGAAILLYDTLARIESATWRQWTFEMVITNVPSLTKHIDAHPERNIQPDPSAQQPSLQPTMVLPLLRPGHLTTMWIDYQPRYHQAHT